ncbi:class I SAM-dependent methyltransferase [Psychroflexus aestuariivivens]|uniref:class I SAM-dependent methyltransferase n=1 Tax=Psychroflexus aestuariivivens TaxID=1795040 RepID=UPI000FDA6A72|nr:class I SAM-dependent methyltransferase [Psychroflexus aestuariivivens]
MSKHQDLTNPNSLRSKIRKKRVKHLINFVNQIIERENLKSIKICDLGGTYRYWLVFPFSDFKEVNFEITLVNVEKAIRSEDENYQKLLDHSNLKFISEVGNGCDMSHKEDNSFHLTHSNSVIEHVGDWQNIKKFAKECQRIGNYYFVQTPNYWFPIEPHYLLPLVHFFPRPIHTKTLMIFKKRSFDRATANFEESRMLSYKEFKFLYDESELITERFFFLPKSFIARSKL